MSRPPASVTIGVIADLHYTPDGTGLAYHGPFDVPGVLERIAAALEWFAEERAHCVVVAGDLTDEGDRDSVEVVLRALSAGWAGHIAVVPGNHDVRQGEDVLRRAAADRIRVLEPAGRFVQGVRLAGIGWDLDEGATRIATWVDEPAVLVSHFPLLSRADAFARRGLRYAGDRPGIEAIRRTLTARTSPTLVINGHLHAVDHARDAQILQLTIGALVESPFEAALISVQADDRSLIVRRRARHLEPTRDHERHDADQTWVLGPRPEDS